MTLGKKIYTMRIKCGLTQEQLAEQLGVSRQSISKYEYDQSTPELEKIKKLARIFDVTPEALIDDEVDVLQKMTDDGGQESPDQGEDGEAQEFTGQKDEDAQQEPSMQREDSPLVKKMRDLEENHNKNRRISGITSVITSCCIIILSFMFSWLAVRVGNLESKLSDLENHTVYNYTDSEPDLLSKQFSAYDYGVKDYDKTKDKVEYYVSCKPFSYSDKTCITAVLSFGDGELVQTIPLEISEENSGIFRGSAFLEPSGDYFDLSFLVDTDGEKQNMDVDVGLSLLDTIDWYPRVAVNPSKSEKGKNNKIALGGEITLYNDSEAVAEFQSSAGEAEPYDILPFISDVKLAFCSEDHTFYEYKLTEKELSDLQKGYGPSIAYQFDIDNDEMLDGEFTLNLQYKNSYINKNLCVSYTVGMFTLYCDNAETELFVLGDQEGNEVKKIVK